MDVSRCPGGRAAVSTVTHQLHNKVPRRPCRRHLTRQKVQRAWSCCLVQQDLCPPPQEPGAMTATPCVGASLGLQSVQKNVGPASQGHCVHTLSDQHADFAEIP